MEKYIADNTRYDNGMEYARCGRSGVLLPKVSLGFWHNFGGVDDYSRSRAITRYAFDHGITHFDLATNTGPYGNWGSRKYLMASLDQSLKRMRIDYADLFYSHRYDPETPLEETLQALVDIVRAGKALYIGISRWPLEALRVAIKYLKEHDVPLLIYQGRLNMIDRAPIEEGIIDECEREGVGFISFSPLAQGLLTDRYLNGVPEDSRMSKGKFLKSDMLTPELLNRLRRLNNQAASRGETLAEMALAWILQHKAVTSVLIGASSTRQLEKNLKCLSAEPI